jgi:hypothetical protein
MHLKKGICLFLFASTILTSAVALDRSHRENLGKAQADGGAPQPPPIPWHTTAIDSPNLNADGGAPPAPPIPWGFQGTELSLSALNS